MDGIEFDGSSFKASANTDDVKVNSVDLAEHLSKSFKQETTNQRGIWNF